MIDKFKELLTQLGMDLDILLTTESNGTCAIKIDDKLVIQVELDKDEKSILFGSFIYELPPGKIRETILINTLKANGQIPNDATFAFNSKSSQLVIFKFISLSDLNVDGFKKSLEIYIEKTMLWKEALDDGQTAPTNFLRDIPQNSSSIFTPKK